MAMQCSGCGKFVAATDVAKCGKCVAVYHRGCVGIPQGARVATSWACPNCRAKLPRTDNSDTPVKVSEFSCEGGDSGAPISAPTCNLTPAPTPAPTPVAAPAAAHARAPVVPPGRAAAAAAPARDSMHDLAKEMKLFRTDFNSMRNEMAGLRQEIAEINKSLSTFRSRIDAVEDKVSRMEERMEERLTAGAGVVDAGLLGNIAQLKMDLNDRDQELLVNDLELTGIPEETNERPAHLVLLVAQKLGVALDDRDIVSANRVGGLRRAGSNSQQLLEDEASQCPPGGLGGARPRPLVVRLARRAPRDELLRAARVRRGADTTGFGLPGPPCRFYVNERLTKHNRGLFYLVRQECAKHGWRAPWTSRGRVLVRRDRDAPANRVRSEADIAQVFLKTIV